MTFARFMELALYAPQWAAWVESAVARPGLESATWWLTSAWPPYPAAASTARPAPDSTITCTPGSALAFGQISSSAIFSGTFQYGANSMYVIESANAGVA